MSNMTETQNTEAHAIRFAPLDGHPYRVECSCGWDASTFSVAASPSRNLSNVRRTAQAHIRAASKAAAAPATATPGCLCCGLLAMRGAELPCGDCRR